jgi:putative endonuclease
VSDKIKIGNIGERLAAQFLEKQGYEIVARNYRYHKSEIDLIARRENWVLFIEVKTRSSTDYGQPEDFVTGQQVNRIYDAAEDWIFANDWEGDIRFDIITVKLGNELRDPIIQHFEDAIN